MKLLKVRVESFKSIEDSEEFNISDVTCLVGKNESGKTAVLQSLNKLNPIIDDESDFNDTLEYPRRKWTSYRKVKDDKPANVLTTHWELNNSEIEKIAQFIGRDSITGNEITIKKGYDNIKRWTLPLNEEKIVTHFIKGSGLVEEELADIKGITNIEDLIDHLASIESPTETQTAFLGQLNSNFPKKNAFLATINLLDDDLPKFVYFADYYKLPGEISINEIKRKQSEDELDFEDEVFLALLDLAGTNIDELNQKGKFEELIAELEAVSNELSDRIFKYWSQNRHLDVEFRLDSARPEDPAPFNSGSVFRTRIENTRHKATVSFDERSTGFIWFFSFLVWFSQAENNYGDKLIILLDEPGLSLHAKAQSDLLEYIDKELKPKYQVLYTTHSPFMIPPTLEGVRTVEDVIKGEEILGTKVSEDVLSTDPDTVFPLQAAIGFDITQTLFVGKNTLLVEGPSDLLYLKWFSNELEKQSKKGLDKNWVITPCGGLDKVSSFLSLFRGNKLNNVVLTDFHKGDKNKVRTLRESQLLKQGSVLSAEMYTGKEEADIEDLVGYENYYGLVNAAYSLPIKNKLTSKTSGQSERVLVDVENHFRTLPASIPEFDHYKPADYLFANSAEAINAMPKFNEALDRFEKLFKDINALLEK